MSGAVGVDTEAAVGIRRILVATDFSPAARLAVWRAGQLAQQHDAHLHLVHAQPDWNLFSRTAPAAAEHYRTVDEHAQGALAEELELLERTFGIRARGETRMGRASAVLRQAMEEVVPQLVVVGARGEHESQMAAPFLGGTALKLLVFSAAPVLIVRKPGTRPYENALVVVEHGGAATRSLVHWAQALIGNGECHIAHAFDVPYAARMRRHGVPEKILHECTKDVRQSAADLLDEVVKEWGSTKHGLHTHLVAGEPVSALLGEMQRLAPDVALVGKHEHAPREASLRAVGSVAVRIAYHAECDVLVAP